MQKNLIKILLTLLMVIVIIILFKHFHLQYYLSIAGFNQYSDQILQFQDAEPYKFVMWYSLVYLSCLILCVPGTVILDIVAGFLFGEFWGTILVVINYTIGVFINFVVVHYLFHEFFLKRFKRLNIVIHGRNQRELFLNLTGLRLIMLIPFWVLNIMASVLNIRLKLYLISVIIGVLPAAIIYAFVGVGAREALFTHGVITAHMLMNPKIWLPLLFFAIITMLPSIFKQIKKYLKGRK